MRGKAKGFTLIELMIIVVIVAILAAVAIPNYTEYVKRSRRTAATTTLHATISAMEKYLLNNNVYPPDIDTLIAGDASNQGVGIQGLKQVGGDWVTRNGYYRIEIWTDLGGNPNSVVAFPQDSQLGDEKCQRFTLFLDGSRTSSDSNGVINTDTCWSS